MADIAAEKEALRKNMSLKRGQLPHIFRQSASQGVCQHKLTDIPGILSGPVAFYMPLKSEFDPKPLARLLATEDIDLCLPRINRETKILDFKVFQFGDDLNTGPYGLKEPSIQSVSVKPRVLLIPLLAVDNLGNRLGYGGGFYDQTLAHLKCGLDVLAVGLCYEMQVIDHVPHDRRDVALDWLLTEEKIRQF